MNSEKVRDIIPPPTINCLCSIKMAAQSGHRFSCKADRHTAQKRKVFH